VYAIGVCTREIEQGRTGGDAVGAGNLERVCFGNVGRPRRLFPGGMLPSPLAQAGYKKYFYLDDDAAKDFEGAGKTTR